MKPLLSNNDFVFTHFQYYRYFHNDVSGGNDWHYIGYMKSGNGKMVSRGVTVTVEAGDLFYIPKGVPYHSYWHTEDTVTTFSSLGFSAFPEENWGEYPLQKIPKPYPSEVIETVLRLERCSTVTSESIGAFFTVLAQLLPCMAVSPVTSPERTVNRAVAWFRQNPHGTATEAAAHCGISESTLYGLFRRTLHLTPVAVKQQILAERATELLTTTDLSVEEISSCLGFSSASYFRKVLQKRTEKTPRELRRTAGL